MPTVWLDRDEAVYGDLPPVCMRCGADATTTRGQTLSWCPSWVIVLIFTGLLPWAVVSMLLTKRMKIKAPMCDRHAGHWFRYKLFLGLGLAGAFLLIVGGFVLLAAGDRDQ